MVTRQRLIAYKYLPADRLDILKTRLVRFTQPYALNDPIEVLPSFGSFLSAAQVDRLFRQLPEWHRRLAKEADQTSFVDALNRGEQIPPFNQVIGIFCLSEIRDSITMWAHYADNHHGAVVGFDVAHPFFSRAPVPLQRVRYVDQRPGLDSAESLQDIRAVATALLTKSKQWEYEHEWRTYRALRDADKVKLSNDKEATDLTGIDFEKVQWDLEPIFLFLIPIEAVVSLILGRRMAYSRGQLRELVVA